MSVSLFPRPLPGDFGGEPVAVLGLIYEPGDEQTYGLEWLVTNVRGHVDTFGLSAVRLVPDADDELARVFAALRDVGVAA